MVLSLCFGSLFQVFRPFGERMKVKLKLGRVISLKGGENGISKQTIRKKFRRDDRH